MKQNSGALSDTAACRHLLRHLDDAKALRANPLVGHLFQQETEVNAVLRELRAVVEKTALDLGKGARSGKRAARRKRQQQILLRCDLKGELHAAVSHDLGICERQFYRERSEACRHLAIEIRQFVRRFGAARYTVLDCFQIELARAQSLRHQGGLAASVGILSELTNSAMDVKRRVFASAFKTIELSEAGETVTAREELRAIRSNLASRPADCEEREEYLRLLDAVEATTFWFEGNCVEATRRDKEAREFLIGSARPTDKVRIEIEVAILLLQANRALFRGAFRDAAIIARRVALLLPVLRNPLPVWQVLNLNMLAGLQSCGTGDRLDSGEALYSEALGLAQMHGYGEQAALAAAGLSIALQVRGNLKAASHLVYESLEVAKHSSAPTTFGLNLLRAAEIEVARGRSQNALELAATALEHFRPWSLGFAVALLFEGHTRNASQDFERANSAAREAYRLAVVHENHRLGGAALRVLAESHSGLGRTDLATEYIRESVNVLERHGHAFSLYLAYKTSQEVTGDRAHARNAAELLDAIAHSVQ